MKHPRWTRALFTAEDLDAIAATVAGAERGTSGEIRVHLERRLPRETTPLARAADVFARLKMDATADRNGVLIYLAVEDRKLAIVGDVGVHARVGDEYWQRVRDSMVERMRAGASRDAIVRAVMDVGLVLRKFFPRRPDDRNELSDEVSLS
jgi:uncharacterized membrane protein